MAKNRIRYFFVLAFCVAFFFCFNGYLSLYVLTLSVVFPVVVFLFSLPGMLGVRLKLEPGAVMARKGRDVPLRLKVESKAFFACGRAKASILVENTLTGDVQEESFGFTPCRGEQAVEHRLTSPSCGRVECRVIKGWVCDRLGIFALPLRLPEGRSVLFLPRMYPTDFSVREISMPDGDGESYSQTKPGDDPSELFGLREYRMGDKLSRLHWKLSQKTGQLLVREPGLPVTDHIFCLMEMNGSGKETDTLLDLLCTLSGFLSERETAHRIGFRDEEGGLRVLEVAGMDDALPFFQILLAEGSRGNLPLLSDGELPAGISHLLYLSCRPAEDLLAGLRLWLPSARMSVFQVSEGDPGPVSLPADAERRVVRPGHISEDTAGLVL